MKKKVSLKIVFTILMSLILIVMLSTTAKAAVSDFEVIKSGEDYIFYIEGYESAKFQFAFSNDSETKVTELEFINNWTDNNDVYVACLDSEMKIDLTKDVFFWVQNENNEMLIEGEKVELSTVLSKELMVNFESLTKLIKVDLTQKNTKTEDVDGVKISKTTGKVVITDSTDYTYKYSLIKVDDSITVVSFLEQLDVISKKYNDMTMLEKIKEIKSLKISYENLLKDINWIDVADMTINQPEESVQGDKYIVLLQKLENDNVIATDIQILNCFESEEIVKENEKIPVKVTTKLPVTGEDITLYVILGIIILVIIAIIVRMAIIKAKGKNENR